jgi:hypothetical protein
VEENFSLRTLLEDDSDEKDEEEECKTAAVEGKPEATSVDGEEFAPTTATTSKVDEGSCQEAA